MNTDRRLEFSEAKSSDIHKWCFGHDLESSWSRPGQSLVSRKICWLIRKRVYSNSPLESEDLFQEIYKWIWENLDKIAESFQESGRPQTWTNFEKYLHTSLKRRLIDTIRRELRQQKGQISPADGYRGEVTQKHLPDPMRGRRLREWHQRSLAVLTQNERNLLMGRLVNGQSVDELAAIHDEAKKAVSRKLHEAKLKFRNEMIRLIAVDYLARHPNLKTWFQAMIMNRCDIGKPCYMYRVNCPKARTVERLARGELKDLGAIEVAKRLEHLKTTVESALDDYELGCTLDRCFWAVK